MGWGAFSDVMTPRRTMMLFGLLGGPACCTIPYFAHSAISAGSSSILPLCGFLGSSFLVVSCFGGLFSVLMSYNTSMFGAKEIAGTHGRLIVGSSVAAFGGPFLLGQLRGRASESAMLDLVNKIDPNVVISEYGSISNLTTLIENKAMTIPQLMQLTPMGTLDPTPFIYDTSLYAAGMAYGIGFMSQMMVGSVSDVHRRVDDGCCGGSSSLSSSSSS